jgi:hypothetical protein
MYGCNGLNRAFEFDGTTFIADQHGRGDRHALTYIKGHRKYLYVAQGSSVMNGSRRQSALRWVASEGASEIAVGDTVTGLVGLPGEALGICLRATRPTFALGASPTTWSLQVIRADVGALAGRWCRCRHLHAG